jgi:ubiquitin C-terminal hydrolase
VRHLLAGRRLDSFLSAEERQASACRVEVELRRADGSWPLGDTTRAVRALAQWCSGAAAPMALPQFLARQPAAKLLQSPILTLCDVQPTPGAWEAGEFLRLPSFGYGTCTLSVIGNTPAVVAAPTTPKANALPLAGAAEEAKEAKAAAAAAAPAAEGGSSEAAAEVAGGSTEAAAAAAPAAAAPPFLTGLTLEQLASVCAPPLTHTSPWRSYLRPGDSASVRVQPAPVKGAAASPPVWQSCKVLDMDFGCYPPTLSVALVGMPVVAPAAATAAATAAAAAAGKKKGGPPPGPVCITVGLESASLRPAVAASPAPQAAAAADPPALPSLAQGVLPTLTSLDCGFLSAKGDASPFYGLEGEELQQAALAQVEEMQARSGGHGAAARPSGVVGFQNIGNTCFMASILQCLAAVEPLTSYFTSPAVLLEVNCRNDWGAGGKLALAWAALTRIIRGSSHGGAVTPAVVKEVLAEKFFVYLGFQQQDCTEFSNNLLNVMSEDLLRSFPKVFNEDGVEGRGRPLSDVADEAWAYHLKREDHIITDVFGGQFQKVMTCSQCGTDNIKCDAFNSLDLSLPQSSYIEVIEMQPTLPILNLKLRVPPPAGKATAASKASTTVAQVATYFHRLRESGNKAPAYLSPEILAEAAADPAAAYSASGCIAALVYECVFIRELKATEALLQPGYTTVFYPKPAEQRYVPLNLRVAWDDEQKQNKSHPFPAPLRHSVIMYEPYIVLIPEGCTNKDVLDRVWEITERFMSPAFRAKHTAENPPYAVHFASAVKLSGKVLSSVTSLAAALKARQAARLPYNSEPFVEDATTCSLVLETSRPYAEWSTLHEFPTALREGRRLVAFKDNMVHPSVENDQNKVDLSALLRLSEEVEVMSGANQVYCARCKSHTDQTNKLRVWRLPPVLCITLKRFKQVMRGYNVCQEKIKDPVQFPVTGLDMTPFIEAPEKAVLAKDVAFAPTASGQRGQPLPPIYDLFAVSHHSGELSGGHYTAHIQDYATGQWYYMDGA